jgi:hypothetical protein
MKKWIDLRDLYQAVKAYADEHCEGNLNLAVRQLVKKGLDNG